MRLLFCLFIVAGLSCSSSVVAAEPADIQALVDAVTGADRDASLQAIDELAKLGPEAKPAVPALLQVIASDDKELAFRAERTLGAMGAEAADAVPALIEELKDESPKVRAYAAFALGRIGKAAIDAGEILTEAAFDEDKLVRRAALRAIRLIDVPREQTRPVVVRILKEGDVDVIMPALQTLAEQREEGVPGLREVLKDGEIAYWGCIVAADIGPEAAPAVPELTELLEHEDPDIRMHALIALGEIGEASAESLPEIVGALTDDEYEANRFAAAFALGKIRAPDSNNAILALVERARNGKPLEKVMSYWALARLRPDREDVVRGAAQKIADALTSEDPHLRTVAAQALVEFDTAPDIVRPVLLAALRDAEPRVVGEAMNALASLGEQALEGFEGVLEDAEARHYATLVLYRMGPKAAPVVPKVVAALEAAGDTEDDLVFRREAHMVLAAIGPEAKAAVDVLLGSLDSQDREVRGSAIYALGKIGPDASAAAPKLTELVQELDEDSGKIGCVWALLKIEPDHDPHVQIAVPLLAKALDNPDDLIRTEAAAALGGIGKPAAATPEIIDRLKQLLQDESEQVCEAAAEALKALE